MEAPDEARNPLAVGLLCAGALTVGRHFLTTGEPAQGELVAWLRAGTFLATLIEALILGVVASAVAHRKSGPVVLLFNAVILAWGAAGLPLPDVGARWPWALLCGAVLSVLVAFLTGRRWRVLERPPGIVVCGLLGIGLPWVIIGRAPAPIWSADEVVESWPSAQPWTALDLTAPSGGPFVLEARAVAGASIEVRVAGELVSLPAELESGQSASLRGEGFEAVSLVRRREVRPTLARADAPSILLVVLDGVGAARTDFRFMPALGGLAHGGRLHLYTNAAASSRETALGALLSGELLAPPNTEPAQTLAERLATRGFATALFAPQWARRASRHGAGCRTTVLDVSAPDSEAALVGAWLREVAGARFYATVVVPSDAPTADDLEAADGNAQQAGQRAADRCLALLLADLDRLELTGTTAVIVVGTVEAGAAESLRQARLLVPLVFRAPMLQSGAVDKGITSALRVPHEVARWAGLVGLELGEGAGFLGPDGARGARLGNWTLWEDADDQIELHQVESDPRETTDLASERPEQVDELRPHLPR
ncbi:MAG: hypothetical protein O2816_03545 [Planctomycetota bacterium]|nr:hypothetical protein [Planctomycetota bacterium]